jgi:hypothetical protein
MGAGQPAFSGRGDANQADRPAEHQPVMGAQSTAGSLRRPCRQYRPTA